MPPRATAAFSFFVPIGQAVLDVTQQEPALGDIQAVESKVLAAACLQDRERPVHVVLERGLRVIDRVLYVRIETAVRGAGRP